MEHKTQSVHLSLDYSQSPQMCLQQPPEHKQAHESMRVMCVKRKKFKVLVIFCHTYNYFLKKKPRT